MTKLVFATNNSHKADEIRAALDSSKYEVMTLKECGIFEDIIEDADTLEGNATIKSRFVEARLKEQGINALIFADDTGLEVEALNGAPGVYSARYSGEGTEGNINKLLHNLEGKENRKAQFRTAISLLELDGSELKFEGIVRGEILEQRDGNEGFGYDPIFKAEGMAISFAQMSMEDKNEISHRGRAVRAMVEYLKNRG